MSAIAPQAPLPWRVEGCGRADVLRGCELAGPVVGTAAFQRRRQAFEAPGRLDRMDPSPAGSAFEFGGQQQPLSNSASCPYPEPGFTRVAPDVGPTEPRLARALWPSGAGGRNVRGSRSV